MAIAIPLAIGGGLLVLGGAGLALRAKALKNAPPIVPVPPTPSPKTQVVPAAPIAVTAALPPLTTNPDGTPHTLGTPFIFTTNDAAQKAVDEANRLGISVHELLLRQNGTLPSSANDAPAVVGKLAIVTTADPSPMGDLMIRTAPSDAAPAIPGGGADKGGTVTIIRDVDAVFAEVDWRGGNRPAGRGFAKKKFLKLV